MNRKMPSVMTELRNAEVDLAQFRTRVFVAILFVLVGLSLIISRMFYLQITKYEDYDAQAESNRTSIIPVVPNRGQILDRYGRVLASNYSAYTLEITPSRVENLDNTIEALGQLLEITTRDKRRFRKLLEESRRFDSLPIRTRLSEEEVARFAAQRYRFPGVDVRARLFRQYPYGAIASHTLGYIGRINQTEKNRMDEWSEEGQANYRGTEYIGKLGIEQAYEHVLHGLTGFERVETSAGGRAVRSLETTPATPGNNVVLTIDIKLQKMIEDMFGQRRGALVAIDPRNGEVLAFVSKPTFDPNLFVEGIDAESWRALNDSVDKPLLNRALRGTYPPGSTYKPFMALGALETQVRSANKVISDTGVWVFGGHQFRGHATGSVDMHWSIVRSSNAYYYSLANEMGVDAIHDFMKPLGFGQVTGIDVPGETRGILPSQEWKRKTYKRPEQQKWIAGETISLGIGQGYNNFTMIQLAHAVATLAARGIKNKPHIVMSIEDVVTRQRSPATTEPAIDLNYAQENLDVVLKAMEGVATSGTSAGVFAGSGYRSGGKTGTAQATTIRQNERYDASRLEEHKRDHSLYIAIAPMEAPRVALAVIVENAGFGAEHAAPIARRVFDYLLLDQYPNPTDMQAVSQGKAGTPLGARLKASEIPWPPSDLRISTPTLSAEGDLPVSGMPPNHLNAPVAPTSPPPPPPPPPSPHSPIPTPTPTPTSSKPQANVTLPLNDVRHR